MENEKKEIVQIRIDLDELNSMKRQAGVDASAVAILAMARRGMRTELNDAR